MRLQTVFNNDLVRPVSTNILDAVGSTPLVQLNRYFATSGATVYAKLEALNPGGSAKDRPAKRMIEEAICSGQIKHDTTIVESSSGNMGIGLAQVCRYYGLKFICVVDPHAQQQNLSIIMALGGTIEQVTEEVDGSFLAARWQRVSQIVEQVEGAFWPNQYANKNNPLAHQSSTIREIDETLGGELDYLFVATSSTGTASGCRDYLRSLNRKTKVVAVDAIGSVLFGGVAGERMIPGLGAGKVPRLARGQTFDDVVRVSDLDCVIGCRRMALQEAIMAGGSAGGVLEAVRKYGSRLNGKTCVAILHDSGTRYLDTVFSDEWVEQKIGVNRSEIDSMLTEEPPVQSLRTSILGRDAMRQGTHPLSPESQPCLSEMCQ
ncbi:UNVERIFIED_CONTAM: hypothetical protein GTU68_011762 [Idotea baltica]|nr:hypothetical protein [Idotea baltica]